MERTKRQLWKRIGLRVGLPAVGSVMLLAMLIFLIVVPAMRRGLLESRQRSLQGLTQIAYAVLQSYARQADANELTLADAQSRALNRLRQLHFGRGGEDYFWVTDLAGRVVMHPVRPDLEGGNLNEMPEGERLGFVEDFTRRAAERGQGFVPYRWYRPGHNDVLVEKLAHVRLFKPWGWVVGTGAYLDDLEAEMAAQRRRLVISTAGVLLLLASVWSVVVAHGVSTERARQATRRALAEAQAKYQAVVENVIAGIILVQGDQIVYANPMLRQMLLLPEDVEAPFPLERILADTPLGRQLMLPRKRERLAGKHAPSEYEAQLVRADGGIVDVEVSAGLTELNGRRAVVAILTDIGKRKRAERDLRASRQRLATLMANVPGMVYRCRNDEKWTMEFVSQGCVELTGYQADDLVENRRVAFGDLIHPDDRRMVHESVASALSANLPFLVEYRIVTQDGSPRWVWERGRGIVDEEGRTLHLEGIILDISHRKWAEDALVASEDRFRTVFETSPDAFLVHRVSDGVFVDVNERFADVTGWSRKEVLGRSVQDVGLWPDEASRRECMEQLRQQGHLREHEVRFRRKDGPVRAGLCSARVVELDGQPHVLSTLRDIEDRKQAEAHRRQLEEQLVQAQKMEAVGRLAGGIAHDFNNQLTVILGYIELLQRMTADPKVLEPVAEMRNASLRAQRLTGQLLTFSRRQVLQPQVLTVNEVLRDLQDPLSRMLGEDIELRVRLEPALRPVRVDRGQLEQTVLNLAINARDAMPAGGTLTIETANVDLPADPQASSSLELPAGPYVLLVVRDTGCGMDAVTRDRAFEPFFTTKGPGRGTGLGLSMAYGFVRQSSGGIALESQPGEGTAFHIYLPQTTETDPQPQEEDQGQSLPGGDEVILVTEDEPTVRALLVQALRGRGYHVLEAGSPREALDLAKTYAPDLDLLVTDVVMPGMNGLELAERFRAMRPDLPVLFVSGYPASGASQGLPRSSLLPKPFTLPALAQAVRNAIDSAQG